MTDILILYESRSREIENCALLATELELRGYEVKIRNICSPFKYFIKPRVLVVPHLYNEQQLIGFAKNFWLSNKNIVDLQYEQILGTSIKEDDIHNPQGQAKFAHHIAWGEDQASRYRSVGIPESNIHVTGSMSMDLMRKEFTNYFLTKQKIARQFNLDPNSEWILFVSSFSYANRTEEELVRYEMLSPTARVFNKLSDETLKEVAVWLEAAALKFPDKTFIYRPHPAEKTHQIFFEITKRTPNFKVIGDYSMRQWAIVADKAYNWYSTSIADLFYAEKSCYIVRPIEIPHNLEVSILSDVKSLKTYEDFENSISNNQFDFPITAERMEYFYGKTDTEPAFRQIADICEKLLKGEYQGFNFDYGNYNRLNICNVDGFGNAIMYWLNIPFYSFCKAFRVKKVIWPFMHKQKVVSLFDKNIYGIEDEIKRYQEKIGTVLKSSYCHCK